MGKAIPKIKEFPDDDRIWRVDWFGSIERNPQVPSEPKVQIIISPLIDDVTDYASTSAVKHEDRQTITVGVGQLPVISIGSLWKNRKCLSKFAGKTNFFNDVKISPETVQLVRSDLNVDGDTLIKRQFHKIGAGLSSNCLAIKWKDDPYGIIIPVLEIIRFYYATSSKLSKALFFGDFRHSLNSIVNPELCGIDRENQQVFIKLRRDFYDADAYVIARILFNSCALAGANLIHDSIVKQSVEGKARLYPEAAFPFEGETTLRARVKGMKIADNHWRNIVFALETCSGEFPYKTIVCDRDNNNLQAPEATDLPDEDKRPAYPIKKPGSEPSEDDELQSGNEPDSDIGVAVVLLRPEDRFGAIAGVGLDKPEKEMCLYISAGNVESVALEDGDLGTGDGNYSPDGTVPVNLQNIRQRQEALPASFDAFKNMIKGLGTRSGYVTSLRERDDLIAHIPLLKKSTLRQWSYLESETQKRRMVLIADVLYQNHVSSLIEFEWRTGESFRLAILTRFDGAKMSGSQIRELLIMLARKEGRWEHVRGVAGQVKIDLLKHTWPTVDDCTNAVSQSISLKSAVKFQ